MDVRLLDLVLQRFCPQRPGADDAQDDQRQPDAERPADAEMLGDITEQWRSQQERDERDLCQRRPRPVPVTRPNPSNRFTQVYKIIGQGRRM